MPLQRSIVFKTLYSLVHTNRILASQWSVWSQVGYISSVLKHVYTLSIAACHLSRVSRVQTFTSLNAIRPNIGAYWFFWMSWYSNWNSQPHEITAAVMHIAVAIVVLTFCCSLIVNSARRLNSSAFLRSPSSIDKRQVIGRNYIGKISINGDKWIFTVT